MPIYMERTILDLEKILINGGKRGFLVGLAPREVMRVAQSVLINAAMVNAAPAE